MNINNMHGHIRTLLALLACAMATYSGSTIAATSLYLNGHAAQTGSTSAIWSTIGTYDDTTAERATITVDREQGRINAILTSNTNIQVFAVGMRTPNGTGLVPGLYAGAVQGGGDAVGHLPSLAASNRGFACTNSNGWFRIIEADFAADGSVEKLAAEFLTWCNGVDSPLFGAVRIDSSVPVPSRDTYAVAGRRLVGDQGQSMTLEGSYSASLSDTPLAYRWTQVSGPAVQLSDATTAKPTFVAPGVTPGGQTLTFQLTVTGAAAEIDTDTVTVFVHHPSDPQTRALVFSPVGEPTLHSYRRYYSTDPQNDDVEDLRYIFNGDDWHFTATMRGSHNLFIKWQGAFIPLRGHLFGLNQEEQLDIELQRGLFVPLAVGRNEAIQSFDPNSTLVPYMQFFGPDGGCDQIGAFDVREIEYPATGNVGDVAVAKLAVDFEQRCATGSDVSVPVRGSIRINSAVPLTDDLVPPLPQPSPTAVQFTISPNPVEVNQPATLSWTSTNAAYCYGFNGFDNRGSLAPSGSVTQTWTAEREQDIYVTCYTSNSKNTDVERLRVVAATSGGGNNPPASGGSGGSGGGGGGAIDGLLLALAVAFSFRRSVALKR